MDSYKYAHNRSRNVAWALCSLVLLAGCGTLPSAILPPVQPKTADEAELEAMLGELQPQRLRSGECGMFLWSRTADRKLVMFSKSDDGGAIVMLSGREQNVPRVSNEGKNVLGYSAQQSYVWRGLFLQVSIDMDQRPEIGRGAVIPTGTISISRRDGWEYVLPVGGIIACEG